MTEDRIKKIAEEAQEAFWTKVVGASAGSEESLLRPIARKDL